MSIIFLQKYLNFKKTLEVQVSTYHIFHLEYYAQMSLILD